MEELTQLHWIALLGGALIMGLSKGGIPGAGNLTVAIYALTLEDAFGPAGVALSVGLLLPVLISADLVSFPGQTFTPLFFSSYSEMDAYLINSQ